MPAEATAFGEFFSQAAAGAKRTGPWALLLLLAAAVAPAAAEGPLGEKRAQL